MKVRYTPGEHPEPYALYLTPDEARILSRYVNDVSGEYLPYEDLDMPARLCTALDCVLSDAEMNPTVTRWTMIHG